MRNRQTKPERDPHPGFIVLLGFAFHARIKVYFEHNTGVYEALAAEDLESTQLDRVLFMGLRVYH
jgi:hypothetical protein